MTKEAIGAPSFVLHGNERELMIKGTPSVVHWASSLGETGRDRAEDAKRRVAESVHRQIVDLARTTPGWEGLDDGVKMRRDTDGSYIFEFDREHPGVERAMQLEFGTPSASPVSIFRRVLAGKRDEVTRAFRKSLR